MREFVAGFRTGAVICLAGAAVFAWTLGACAPKPSASDRRVDPAELDELARAQAERRAELERARNEAIALAQRAQQEAGKGRVGPAIELYGQALARWSRMPGAHNNLGKLLVQAGRYQDAADAFFIASELSPSDPRPLANLGKLKMDIGWPSEAYGHYEKALERDPNDLESLRGVIAAADLLRRADEQALDYARRALLLETDATWRSYLERQRYRIEQDIDEP
ncbi:MAG: hypothetical protein ACF8SC_07450 [Phycisphaerales bacterium JB037]